MAVFVLLCAPVVPAQAAATFSSAGNLAVGTNPRSIAVGDFDGDGHADLAVVNFGSANLSIRLGAGDGTFGSASNVTVGLGPHSVAAGDFNADGKTDLAVSNTGPDNVSIRLGVGNGAFTSADDVTSGLNPYTIAVGDFNGDGHADLAIDNFTSNSVSIRLGVGDGTFMSAADVTTGAAPRSVAVGDFNGDGVSDLAVANSSPDNVSIRLGMGDGTFTNAANVGVGLDPNWVAVGDFNGDAKADLAVANRSANNVSIRLGRGNGTFTSATDVGVGTQPSFVAIADFDSDGNADLAVPNNGSNNVSVGLGAGDGTFTSAADVGAGTTPLAIAVGDFNSDDHPDLAVANFSSGNVSIRMNEDTTAAAPPTCQFWAVSAGPPEQAVVGAFDLRSGIRSISVATQVNAAVRIDPFTPLGTFSPGVRVIATKIDENATSSVTFFVTDGAGQQTTCLALPVPRLSVDDVTMAEGDTGTTTFTFTATRTGDAGSPASVQWSTAAGSAVAPGDYTGVAATTLNFAAGDTTKTFTVDVVGDTAVEVNDGFTVVLSNPFAAAILDGTGVGRITNDDVATFSVSDAPALAEGNSGTTAATFSISRTGATGGPASVRWGTLNAQATAGVDYVGVPATQVNFLAGETTKTVTVDVIGDTAVEQTEAFYVRLSVPVGATIADGSGTGVITNDDDSPATLLSVSDVSVAEGDEPGAQAQFTVSRSGDTSSGASVQWFTVAHTATAGDDYASVDPTTLSFEPGETSKTVSVTINGDTAVEANEAFFVRLTAPIGAAIADGSGLGRISNDDFATVSVNDATVTEGDNGTTLATFTITRTGATGGAASVTWATANGTATAAGDYLGVPATVVTFDAGETTKTLQVTVNGDTTPEANETFYVKLTAPVNAGFGDPSGLGRITNDD